MNEVPTTRAPALFAPNRGRTLHSTSDLPPSRRRNTDDLLSNLTPRTVVDAFRNPAGSLQACMQAATPAEQAFALRVAIAANSIHEWLEELTAWPWPAGGGSAGFESSSEKKGELFNTSSELSPNTMAPLEQGYVGSLPATDLAKYEKRIDEISQGLDELDVEEIKSQVLNNHIIPLSRPGTPIMGSGRSTISALSSITLLDDLTALVTATTVQALPKISKLAQLMNAWSFRLLVLRKIPVFLTSIVDAEVALQSGWNAISIGGTPDHAAEGGQNGMAGTTSATLSRADLDVMKSVLGRKVARTGRDLDSMLNVLEGQPDTLPEDWIDRVDAVERGYSEWTVAGERKVKETGLARSAAQVVRGENVPEQAAERGSSGSAAAFSATSKPVEMLPPVIKIHPTTDSHAQQPENDMPDTDDEDLDQGTLDGAGSSTRDNQVKQIKAPSETFSGSDSELSDISDPPVPELRSAIRRDSNASQSSTAMHDDPSTFADSFTSDQLDHGTPERPRQRDISLDGDMPEFPSFRSSTRSMSVSFNDQPIINELPSFPSPPSTPTKSVSLEEGEDDVTTEPDSPSEISMPGADDQLQQQISDILQSVPAKIRLTAEPPAINLNPPDFKMPTVRKGSRSDAIPRSQSNLSIRSAYSRSGTPSFTLAPAYGRSSRARPQRGNQEIKLYHLSRSNGEAPIKLFIRCVGEHGERVMVRVGGGWADLGEYLKEYASHHLRRSAGGTVSDGKVEVKDVPRSGAVRADSSPPSRPASALDASHHHHSPVSPLRVRKTRRPSHNLTTNDEQQPPLPARPKTPLAAADRLDATPPSDASSRCSRGSSWDEDERSLGMAGPRAKNIGLSEERRAWVESVKEKVRIASVERKVSLPLSVASASAGNVVAGGSVGGDAAASAGAGGQGLGASLMDRGSGGGGGGKAVFGEMGKVGSTKRLFRRG